MQLNGSTATCSNIRPPYAATPEEENGEPSVIRLRVSDLEYQTEVLPKSITLEYSTGELKNHRRITKKYTLAVSHRNSDEPSFILAEKRFRIAT